MRLHTQRTSRRRAVTVATLLVASVLLTPSWAAAAPPGNPVPTAPADGATGVLSPTTLSVAVSDPDGEPLDVRFLARPRSTGTGTTNPAGDFSFVLIPDTQNYVSTSANRAIMGAQTQWIVDNRAALGTAFVSHLGDIVGTHTSTTQWNAASLAMRTLDDAAVPNSVLPGNHDFDVPTGDAPLYQQYFPVSRYAGASWNSATASYGGYLGQNLFGPDPVDRQNMDSFSLFTAGGMDFLVLSLEYNPPDYAIDWAKRVLAAYPDRRAILVTHSFVNVAGAIPNTVDRPGGNGPAQLWTKLVQPSCGIFMVVNGHFHDGDLSEARRTDTNACGRPVQSVLSDYQERVNGGDGWLRYYTFRPATNQIQAFTYSPTLGRFETDDSSAFTLPYDMTVRTTAPFTEVGAVTSAGGSGSVTVPGLTPGTTYEWYATASDGTTTTQGPLRTFTTAATTAQPTVLAADTFTRSTANGWGAAGTGGTWTGSSPTSRSSVTAGAGAQLVPAGATTSDTLPTLATTDTDLTVKLAVDAVPNAATYLWASARRLGAADYSARVKVNPNGATDLHVTRSGTVVAGGALGLTLAAGQQLQVRVQTQGTSPTTIRARAWRAGTPEPTAWSVTTTDATAGLQAAGGVRLAAYVSSSASTAPLTVRWDDLSVTTIGTTPPANVSPTASFTASPSQLTATLDGAASTDTDGTITSYAWTFGDGTGGTGSPTTHTYAAAGTYTVGLTVTDDDGATGTTTRQVTVSGPPPSNVAPTASFTSTTSTLTATLDGAASTDTDGTITSYAWTFGDGTGGTGSPTTHTYAAAGTYTVGLTVTDDDGATGTTTRQVTVSSASTVTTLSADAFTRTTSSGWGAADVGGAWTVSAAARTSVGGGSGQQVAPAGTTTTATLASPGTTDTDLTVRVSVDAVANGATYLWAGGRRVGAADYSARIKVNPNGVAELHVTRTGTVLAGGVITGPALAPGQQLQVRVQTQGTSPTTIRARAWRVGSPEPTTWQVTTTDATAGLQTAGGVRLATYLSSSATTGALTARWDDLSVTPIG